MNNKANSNSKAIWFDKNINNDENKKYIQQLKSLFNNIKGYQSLDEGFENLYENDFRIVFVIVSGSLYGRYLQKIKENVNKIINIP